MKDRLILKFNEAWALRAKGESDQYMHLAKEGLDTARSIKDPKSEALFLKLFAQNHSDNGDLRESLKIYKQIERLYVKLQMPEEQMHTLRHIGDIYLQLGELECAQKCLVQVVEAYEQNPPNNLEAANAHRVYALTTEKLKQIPTAIRYWKKARAGYQSLGISEGIKECDEHLRLLAQ